MNGYHLIPILLFAATVVTGQSQDSLTKPTRNSILVQYGVVHLRSIDFGFTQSNLLFTGTNSKIGLTFERETTRHVFSFSASVSFGDLTSESGRLPSELIFLEPELAYYWKLQLNNSSQRKRGWFVGVNINSKNYFQLNEAIHDNYDLFCLHGLYASLRYKINFSPKQALQLSYLLPVLVFENHVLWNGGASALTIDDKEEPLKLVTGHGEFNYLPVSRNIQLSAMYIRRLGKNTNFELTYRFFYANSQVQAPVKLYSNELVAGLRFKF